MNIKKIIAVLISAGLVLTTVSNVFALDADNVEPWERSAETHRENLGNSIAYLEAMDTSDYTKDSVEELNTAIKTAKSEYENANQSAKFYYNARNQLEYARAKLVYSEIGEDGPNKLPFRELSAKEIIDEMGAGINFGNTMDGHNSMVPDECAWQPQSATKEQITSMHDGGYNTVRIPVTWGLKIKQNTETGAYTIDEAWLNRVTEVVDYAIDNGMYVIINIHHDGVNWSKGWFNIGNNDIDSVMEKYAAVWKIIAERFKDYDEHLIFESMNEMTAAQADGNMWNGGAFEYDVDILRNFNQLFMNTVRATGSNNTKRWLVSKGHFAYTGKTTMPIDPINDGVSHQMYSAHIYNSVENRYNGIKELADNYKDLGCPLILGEWTTYTGDDGSTATGYNDIEKAFQSELVYKYAKANNICAIAWDIGVFEKNGRIEGGNASYWSRSDLKPGFQSVLRGVMRGAYLSLTEENRNGKFEEVYTQYGLNSKNGVDQHPKSVIETKITDITCENSIDMTVGEIKTLSPAVTPNDTNDLLVWTTNDDSVAVVSNGRITAKKAGTAVITAYALNTVEYGYYGHYNEDPYANAVKKEITVNVRNTQSNAELTGSDSMELAVNKSAPLDVSSSEVLTYVSDNEGVATVNSVGRIFAKSIGEANITVTAANGKSKTVKITVAEDNVDEIDYVKVGIFVLYNDSEHQYWDNEIGETAEIRNNGTYTLTYDISKHQSEMAKAAGIDTINNLTAIYLKDVEVHFGDIPKSAFRHCLLKWEKVEINGQEMKLSDDRKEYLSPIKASSGVFDSGRPVNSWEGNDIEGVSVSDYTAVFTDIEKPTSVTLTFTISQIMLRSIPLSEYVEEALAEAEKIDTSLLSETKAKEFGENVEALRVLYNDEEATEKKLISAYSKVKIVIDELTVIKPEITSSAPAAESEITSGAASENTQTENENGNGNDNGNGNTVLLIVLISAVLVLAAVFIIIRITGRKKAESNDRKE